MPPREGSAYIWEVLEAAKRLETLLTDFDQQKYLATDIPRLAAERLLIIIGEAVGQLAKVDPNLASELGEVPEIVSFRNVLVHGYFKVDHAKVWLVITNDVPALRAQAERIWSRYAPLYKNDPPIGHDD